jgi:hypothetical protein
VTDRTRHVAVCTGVLAAWQQLQIWRHARKGDPPDHGLAAPVRAGIAGGSNRRQAHRVQLSLVPAERLGLRVVVESIVFAHLC